MYNPEIPEILMKLYNIIDGAKDYFSQFYYVSKSMTGEEYGIYIMNQKSRNSILYLGIWYPFWKVYHCPLCYGIDPAWGKDIEDKFLDKHKDDVINYNGFKTVCIRQEVLKEDDCLDKIINIMEEELKILA